MNTIYDFETLSQNPQDGVVLSMAMLNWDPKIKYTYHELVNSAAYIKFDVAEQVEKYDRKISPSTLAWWGEQNKEAQKALKPSSNDKSITELYDFYCDNMTASADALVYTRRNTFDPVFMLSVMNSVGRDLPYAWWDVRDTISYIEGLTYGADTDHRFIPEGLKDKFVAHDPRHDIAMDVMRIQTLMSALDA